MCIYFDCQSCAKRAIIYCESVDIYNAVDPGCGIPTLDPESHNPHKKCETCKIITGVQHELTSLVYQNPWLETEGMGGIEHRAEWEVGPSLFKKEQKIVWGRSRVDEEHEMAEKLKRMGLANLAGQEAFNEGEGLGKRKAAPTTRSRKELDGNWGSQATTAVEEGLFEEEDKIVDNFNEEEISFSHIERV